MDIERLGQGPAAAGDAVISPGSGATPGPGAGASPGASQDAGSTAGPAPRPDRPGSRPPLAGLLWHGTNSSFDNGSGSAPALIPTRPWPLTFTRRLIVIEVCAVLAVSLGRSAVSAILDLAGSLAAPQSLGSQQATLNGSASTQPWLNLAWQVYGVAFGLAPVLLVAYMLMREGAGLRVLGVDRSQPGRDLGRGAIVAALIGGSGLLLYLGAHAAGLALTVVPESLPAVWWRIPVLIASAFQNAALEEVVVLGFLLRRFDQLGWSERRGDLTSAAIRGSYHLYQGFGGFVGNFVMGVVFARLYRRWGRVTPLLLAHGLIDTATFVGYVFLAGHVSWLPV